MNNKGKHPVCLRQFTGASVDVCNTNCTEKEVCSIVTATAKSQQDAARREETRYDGLKICCTATMSHLQNGHLRSVAITVSWHLAHARCPQGTDACTSDFSRQTPHSSSKFPSRRSFLFGGCGFLLDSNTSSGDGLFCPRGEADTCVRSGTRAPAARNSISRRGKDSSLN